MLQNWLHIMFRLHAGDRRHRAIADPARLLPCCNTVLHTCCTMLKHDNIVMSHASGHSMTSTL
jgi:hypothetical protein